jgi:hypothetical protein
MITALWFLIMRRKKGFQRTIDMTITEDMHQAILPIQTGSGIWRGRGGAEDPGPALRRSSGHGPGRRLVPDLTRANRLVTCFESLEDVAGGVGEVGVEGEALAVDLDGR